MPFESTKTRQVRGADFEQRYLQGRVIDIGCGPDLVVSHAEPFDIEDGNAEQIGSLRPQNSYDAVHSSHCLEHMSDAPAALAQWWSLVKPGGFLIVVVPEEDLYEQGFWPSLFNTDHKSTFRLRRPTTWSPKSQEVEELFRALPGAKLISAELYDANYDYSLKRLAGSSWGRFLFRVNGRLNRDLKRLGLLSDGAERALDRLMFTLGAPIDQLSRKALAQIQIIAQKEA